MPKVTLFTSMALRLIGWGIALPCSIQAVVKGQWRILIVGIGAWILFQGLALASASITVSHRGPTAAEQ